MRVWQKKCWFFHPVGILKKHLFVTKNDAQVQIAGDRASVKNRLTLCLLSFRAELLSESEASSLWDHRVVDFLQLHYVLFIKNPVLLSAGDLSRSM